MTANRESLERAARIERLRRNIEQDAARLEAISMRVVADAERLKGDVMGQGEIVKRTEEISYEFDERAQQVGVRWARAGLAKSLAECEARNTELEAALAIREKQLVIALSNLGVKEMGNLLVFNELGQFVDFAARDKIATSPYYDHVKLAELNP
jgi:hypothetical protein